MVLQRQYHTGLKCHKILFSGFSRMIKERETLEEKKAGKWK